MIEVTDDLLHALDTSVHDAAADEIRMTAAVKLRGLGRLSSVAVARLAAVPRGLFLSKLADYGVDTSNLTEDELERQTSLT